MDQMKLQIPHSESLHQYIGTMSTRLARYPRKISHPWAVERWFVSKILAPSMTASILTPVGRIRPVVKSSLAPRKNCVRVGDSSHFSVFITHPRSLCYD